jgi:hypothetical protein
MKEKSDWVITRLTEETGLVVIRLRKSHNGENTDWDNKKRFSRW